MKTEITKSGFMDAFNACGRGEQFSYDAKSALYDWLEELSEETGEEYSLDVIALCCEYTEYDSAIDCLDDYLSETDWMAICLNGGGWEDEEEKEQAAIDYLNERTLMHVFNGGIIITQF
jgi:hypothetical protein